MKSKKLLRFYFRADKLNAALDNLIMRAACASATGNGEACAEKLIELIVEKSELSSLWAYLDEVMSTFGDGDRSVLRGYALSLGGYSGMERDRANAVRRVVVRFMRRAKYLYRHAEGAGLVVRYYVLLGR